MIIIFSIVAILCVAGTVIHINNKTNFKSNNQEQYMATIVMKGFELKIPDRYMATYDESIGLMYWSNDYFDMMIDVEAGDYEKDVTDKLGEINELMETELVVVRPYSEITIDGKSYTYMLYYDAGIPTIHCYAKADEDDLFSVMVLCNEMAMVKPQSDEEIRIDCEELISIADSIIRTSKSTDKDNSPSGEVFVGNEAYEHLYSEVELNLSHKYIEHDYVQGISTKAKANYSVKNGYYCTGSKNKDGIYYMKLYGDYNDNIVSVYIEEKDNLNYDILSTIKEGCEKWTGDTSVVSEYKLNDYNIYYYTYLSDYIYENEQIIQYNYVSMLDLGDGYVYVVEGNGVSNELSNPEFYKDFYNVNLEKTQ